MNRDEFMELVYETFADEPDNVLANGIIEAADAYAEHEKAQLSQEGTTKDAISRQDAIDALDTAIEHYDGIAEECRKKADIERNDYMDMRDDAYEARQLAQWLNELKYLRKKIEQLTIQPEERTEKRMETHACDLIDREAAVDAIYHHLPSVSRTEVRLMLHEVSSVQPERTCVNCGRTVNNGGWYADGGTRCPIEEHYALPKDGYCHLWEKRNITDDDYPERRTDE